MILRGFKDGHAGLLQCMTTFYVSKSFWLLIFSLLLWRKVLEVLPVFSVPCPAALHRHMQSDILPHWRGQSPTAVSIWLPQFWIPPQGSLLLTNTFFSLSKLPFVAILALHRQHKKPLADFSSPSCRGTCNWQQLTPVWSMLIHIPVTVNTTQQHTGQFSPHHCLWAC